MLLSNTVFFLRVLVIVFDFCQGYKVCVMIFIFCLGILTGGVVIRHGAVLLIPGHPDKSRICVPWLNNELPLLVSLCDNVL